MKKLLILGVCVLIAGVAVANDLSVVFTDSIVAADTGDVRVDTTYTGSMDISDLDYLTFVAKLSAYQAFKDTNWTDDTFFVNLQHSFDGQTWTTLAALDTLLDNGTGYSVLQINRTDSILYNQVRGMLIHWDSIGVGEGDAALVDSTYGFRKLFQLYINGLDHVAR